MSKKMEFLAKLNFYGPLFKFKYARPLLILRKKIIIKITNFFRSIFVKLENKQNNADIESLQKRLDKKNKKNLTCDCQGRCPRYWKKHC